MAGASYLLQSMERWFPSEVAECRDKLNALEDTLSRAVDTVRTVAKGLSPIEIRHGGLEAACHRLALDVATMYDIEVRIDDCDAVGNCSSEIKTAMYYIVHEAVFNAAKHSGCKHITISFDADEQFISASVGDDGAGIQAETAEGGGLGIRLMTQRAEALGGGIEMSSGQGPGTLILCRLPHNHANQIPASADDRSRPKDDRPRTN